MPHLPVCDWNFPAQMLAIRMAEGGDRTRCGMSCFLTAT